MRQVAILGIGQIKIDEHWDLSLREIGGHAAFLMDRANMETHSREWQGIERHYYAITFGERYIWGVTAGILRNMRERIFR